MKYLETNLGFYSKLGVRIVSQFAPLIQLNFSRLQLYSEYLIKNFIQKINNETHTKKHPSQLNKNYNIKDSK